MFAYLCIERCGGSVGRNGKISDVKRINGENIVMYAALRRTRPAVADQTEVIA